MQKNELRNGRGGGCGGNKKGSTRKGCSWDSCSKWWVELGYIHPLQISPGTSYHGPPSPAYPPVPSANAQAPHNLFHAHHHFVTELVGHWTVLYSNKTLFKMVMYIRVQEVYNICVCINGMMALRMLDALTSAFAFCMVHGDGLQWSLWITTHTATTWVTFSQVGWEAIRSFSLPEDFLQPCVHGSGDSCTSFVDQWYVCSLDTASSPKVMQDPQGSLTSGTCTGIRYHHCCHFDIVMS